MTIRVLVWNEGVHEATQPDIAAIYPAGIHGAIAEGLTELLGDDITVRTATLADPEHGLSAEALDQTDVLLWWGHIAHDQVDDAVVTRVQEHVHAGMGLLVLHSGHFSKIFTRLLGTTCSLKWRNEAERELVWTVAPTHPIAEGVEHPIVIDHQEMYGELFDIPTPDDLVFISSFAGGEVFRSGVTFTRGHGQDLLLQPGRPGVPRVLPPADPSRPRERCPLCGPRGRASRCPPGPVRRQPRDGLVPPRLTRTPRRRRCSPFPRL